MKERQSNQEYTKNEKTISQKKLEKKDKMNKKRKERQENTKFRDTKLQQNSSEIYVKREGGHEKVIKLK